MKDFLTVNIKQKKDLSYPIVISVHASELLTEFLKNNFKDSKLAIICDKNTEKLFGKNMQKELKKAKFQAELISFSSGEQNKNLLSIEQICDKMVKLQFTRKDVIIALGGGVCGDMAGFVAAIYMRGIAYIQMPTSLLAMVDSSIGGKTGVDLQGGKNLIGSFKQPKAVFINPQFLEKLPTRQFNNGMAEIIKHAIILDKKFFEWLEENQENIARHQMETLEKMIHWSCKIKKKVVEQDETEKGLRMALNYGHTIGHALEQLSKYEIAHGEAVSIGMVHENKLQKTLSSAEDLRIKSLLGYFKLPIKHPLLSHKKALLKFIMSDKKRRNKLPMFAIPHKMGTPLFKEFKEEAIIKALS